MLSWIRKRAGGWWVKALYIGIAITFFGGFGLLSSSSTFKSCAGVSTGEDNAAGLVMVDGSSISEREFEQLLNQRQNQLKAQLQQQFQDQPIPQGMLDLDVLRPQVMKSLIQERLVRKQAQAMGIEVSDQELQNQIAMIFGQGNPANFDPAEYSNRLRALGLSEANFENQVRDELANAKVQQAIRGAVSVLPDEVRERYAFEHQPVKLEYISLDPAVLAPDAVPGETAIKAYYADHLDRFNLDETRQVEFVAWKLADVAPGLTVTDQEISEYYAKARDRYLMQPEQVRAQHILIKVDQNASPEDIQKAKALITKVQEEANKPGADFGALAKQYSEDGTKEQGGDLGFFVRNADAASSGLPSMVGPFEQAAFALEIGKVSEPVQTEYGFHLIKVTEKKPAVYKSLEDVRKDVEAQLRETKAMDAATTRAEAIRQALNTGKSFAEAAAAAGVKVQTSNFFQARDNEILGVPDSRAVIEGVFDLNEGDVTEPIKGETTVFLARLVKIAPEHQATIAEVRDRIIAALKPEIQRQAALAAVQKLLERAKAGELDFAALATEAKGEVKKVDATRVTAQLEGVVGSDTVTAAMDSLTAAAPWAGPVVGGDRVVVFHLLEAGEPNLANFDADQEAFAKKLLAEKQNRAVQAWLDGLTKQATIVYSKRWKEMNAGQN